MTDIPQYKVVQKKRKARARTLSVLLLVYLMVCVGLKPRSLWSIIFNTCSRSNPIAYTNVYQATDPRDVSDYLICLKPSITPAATHRKIQISVIYISFEGVK